MSGDIGDFWRDVKPILKQDRAERIERNLDAADEHMDALKGLGVRIQHHTDWHYTLTKGPKLVDFWPSKMKWQVRGEKRHQYGIEKLKLQFS